MSLQIQPGTEVVLPADFANSVITMGLRWDLFDVNDAVDLDASCSLFDSFGNLLDAVFYNNLKSADESVVHSGDNKTGEGEGDDESITLYMQKINPSVKVLIFSVNCYSGGTFTKVESANVFIRNGTQVLSSLSLGCQGDHTGFIMCMIYKKGNDWFIRNISQKAEGKNFKDIEKDMKTSMEFLIPKELQDEGSNWNPGKVFNLSKGDSITVPVVNFGVGLGWDVSGGGVDLDSSCKLYGVDGQLIEDIYFGSKTSRCGGVKHSGDNLTGQGSGDDERINVKISQLSPQVNFLVFTITIYTVGRDFASVKNAYCRLVDEKSGSEVCKYKLTEMGHKSAVIMCVVYRTPSLSWKIKALGESTDGRTCRDLSGRSHELVTSLGLALPLPVPTSDQINNAIHLLEANRKTVKYNAKSVSSGGSTLPLYNVTVIEGKNLISKDSNGLSDPYIKVIYPTTSKSEIVKKNLNPTWNHLFFVPKESTQIIIQVWDWDRLKDDFMGEAIVTSTQIQSLKQEGKLGDFWVDLKVRQEKASKDKVSGSIRIKITE